MSDGQFMEWYERWFAMAILFFFASFGVLLLAMAFWVVATAIRGIP